MLDCQNALAATLDRLPSKLAVSDDLGSVPEVSVELTEVPKGPSALVVGSSEPASDSKARALKVDVTNAVAAVFSDVPSAQPVVSAAYVGAVFTDYPADARGLPCHRGVVGAHAPAGSTAAFDATDTAAVDGTSFLCSDDASSMPSVQGI